MSALSSLIDRLWEMPRAMRWIVVFGVFIVAFLVWDGAVRPTYADWRDQANAIEAKVHKVRDNESIIRKFQRRQTVLLGLGKVEPPGAVEEGIDGLSRAIVEVLETHSIRGDRVDFKGDSGLLPRDVSARLLKGTPHQTKRLKLVSSRMRFPAKPETAVQIIAELERRPEIESISDVNMIKDEQDQMIVTLTVEAWVLEAAKR